MIDITLVTTGGTIDKTYGSGIGVRDLHVGRPVAHQMFMQLQLDNVVTFHVKSPFAKDSIDMTDEDRAEIVRICDEAGTLKIIVTHGTDTMKETAQALSKEIDYRKTIVLTGASKPACMKGSDAKMNLGLALGACLFVQRGIFIAMNGVHAWNRCVKSSSGIFQPIY